MLSFMKKKFFLTAMLAVSACMTLCAQGLGPDIYDQPLKEVLSRIETVYGVKLEYQDKNVKGKR